MSDFDLYKALNKELIETLENRAEANMKERNFWVSQDISRAKIQRLRLQITEVLKRIERKCIASVADYKYKEEDWYK